MIIGRGLIATAFHKAQFNSDQHIIFASGVSNSSESNLAAFQREQDLLSSYIDKSTTIVYFSTTSIFDPTKSETAYIKHKLHIESMIRYSAPKYIIVRLPIMVGKTENPHTLINYLVNGILQNRQMVLQRNACRHLLDIDDLFPLLEAYLKDPSPAISINILGSAKTSIPDLINALEDTLGTKGNYSWTDDGACYDVPPIEGECIFVDCKNYVKEVLNKYFAQHHS